MCICVSVTVSMCYSKWMCTYMYVFFIKSEISCVQWIYFYNAYVLVYAYINCVCLIWPARLIIYLDNFFLKTAVDDVLPTKGK